jgi:hypothetical protein
MAMQRIGRDDAAFEGKQRQYLQRPLGFVAARSLLLGKRHPRLHRPDVDHVQRFVARTALEGASQCLAVDRHHAGEIEPVGLGKGRHEASECGLEGTRLEQTEHAAEGIVTGNPVLQPQRQPQQSFLGLPELRHVRAGLCSAQHRRQGDNQYFQQIAPRIGRPRVRQTPKNLLELLHPTPSTMWEPFSESNLRNNAIEAANPYAIPLPRAPVRWVPDSEAVLQSGSNTLSTACFHLAHWGSRFSIQIGLSKVEDIVGQFALAVLESMNEQLREDLRERPSGSYATNPRCPMRRLPNSCPTWPARGCRSDCGLFPDFHGGLGIRVIGVRWTGIDRAYPTRPILKIPGERMKRDEDHNVPLTRPALAVLDEMSKRVQDELISSMSRDTWGQRARTGQDDKGVGSIRKKRTANN